MDFPHDIANASPPLPSATISTSLHLYLTFCHWKGHYVWLLCLSKLWAATRVYALFFACFNSTLTICIYDWVSKAQSRICIPVKSIFCPLGLPLWL